MHNHTPIVMTAVTSFSVFERILYWLHQIPEMLAPFIAIASFVGATVSACYWVRKFYRERKKK